MRPERKVEAMRPGVATPGICPECGQARLNKPPQLGEILDSPDLVDYLTSNGGKYVRALEIAHDMAAAMGDYENCRRILEMLIKLSALANKKMRLPAPPPPRFDPDRLSHAPATPADEAEAEAAAAAMDAETLAREAGVTE